jgi:nitroreductase / dihydropteridine reductase
MNLAQLARTRRTAKAFDPDRKIPAPLLEQLRVLLRHSPSSINSQPWHFVFAASPDAKARIARAMPPPYAYNGPKVLHASHVVVLCVRTNLDDSHLEAILAQEIRDGRFPDPEAAAAQRKSRRFYADLHQIERGDVRHWMEKQAFLALGTLLLGAAALGLDACPMEGFDPALLDRELGLAEKSLAAVVLVALGYRGAGDWNAALPKSRLPAAAVLTDI